MLIPIHKEFLLGLSDTTEYWSFISVTDPQYDGQAILIRYGSLVSAGHSKFFESNSLELEQLQR